MNKVWDGAAVERYVTPIYSKVDFQKNKKNNENTEHGLPCMPVANRNQNFVSILFGNIQDYSASFELSYFLACFFCLDT